MILDKSIFKTLILLVHRPDIPQATLNLVAELGKLRWLHYQKWNQ
jgi:hypothetical protein